MIAQNFYFWKSKLYHMKKLLLFLLIPFQISISYAQNPASDHDSLFNYINHAFQKFQLNGLSVLIVKNDSIVFDENWGDAGKGQKVESESVYNIASCTKAFTGAAMAKLVNEGLIKWDDKVVDYLPDFKLEDPYITAHLSIEDLLTHRSGLGTFYGDLLWYETDRSNEDIIERMQYLPITNRFRDQFGYQNTTYIVAAEILEKVTGRSWEDYIEQELLLPLKMNNTVTCADELREDQKIAYPMIDGETIGFSMKHPHAAASLFSSTQDLSRWMRMLLNNGVIEGDTILNAAIIEDMMKSRRVKNINGLLQMAGAQFNTYALGWNMFDEQGKKVVEHGGGMPGYISKVCVVPQEKLGIVILTNTLSSAPTALEMYILDAFLKDQTYDWVKLIADFEKRGKKAEEAEQAERDNSRILNTHPSLELENYVGIYEDQMYGKASITLENGKLHLVFEPSKNLFFSDMEHWHYDTFKVKFADPFLPAGYITFSFDSRRNIEGFKIDLKSNDFHFFNLDFKKVE